MPINGVMVSSRIREFVRRPSARRDGPPCWRPPWRSKSGMTFPEVMIGFVIIGTAAMAALSGILFSWRLADSNLRALGAMETARAVAEQVITLDFETLAGVTLPIDVPSNPSGSMNVGVWNNRTDDIHNTPGVTADDLIMSFKPQFAFSNDESGVRCAQIVIRYSWEEHSFFSSRTREGAITLIRSPISAY